MSEEQLSFVVGIKNKQDEIVGTGFVIAEEIIVTCGHVVEKILTQINEEVKEVKVTFSKGDSDYQTTIESCNTQNDKDIAILRSNKPLPIKPAILCSYKEVKETPIEFSTIGYQEIAKRTGIPTMGKLLGIARESEGKPPLILETTQDNQGGISGAPLYLPQINRVVGMITSYSATETKRAFAIPTDVIQKVWSYLKFQPPELPQADKVEDSITVNMSGGTVQGVVGAKEVKNNQFIFNNK